MARPELCRAGFEILSFTSTTSLPADLKAITAKTYNKQVYGFGEITPLKPHLEPGLALEALSNGPTLAFKDMAMQLLGNLFENTNWGAVVSS